MARRGGRGPSDGAAVWTDCGLGGAGGVTVSWPARLAVGGEVGLRGSGYTITALADGTVALAGVSGEVLAMPVAELLTDSSFTVMTPPARAPLPARGVLDGLPAEVAGRAQWWERHVTEVLAGVSAGSPPGTAARAEYDPLRVSLRQRELSMVAELRAAGEPVSLATLGRMWRRYRSGGLLGLVDGRLRRGADGAVDGRHRDREGCGRRDGPVHRHGDPAAAAGGAGPGRRARHRPGAGHAAADHVLPAGRADLGRTAHVRVRADAAVAGAAPGRPVRLSDGAAPRGGIEIVLILCQPLQLVSEFLG